MVYAKMLNAKRMGAFIIPQEKKFVWGQNYPGRLWGGPKVQTKYYPQGEKNFGMLTMQVGRGYRGRHCGGGGGEKEVVGQSDPAEEKLFWREEEKSLRKEGEVEVGRRWWRGRRCRCETFFCEPTPFPSISWPRLRLSTFCEEKKSPVKVVHSSGRRGQANEMDPVKPEEAEYSDSSGWPRLVASQKGPIDMSG